MPQTQHSIMLGASVVVPVRIPNRRKPVKVHLEKGTKLPILYSERRDGAEYLAVLSSYGELLVCNQQPHRILVVNNAPDDATLEQFIVEKAVAYHKGERHVIAHEE